MPCLPRPSASLLSNRSQPNKVSPHRSLPALPSHPCPNRNSTHPIAPLLPRQSALPTPTFLSVPCLRCYSEPLRSRTLRAITFRARPSLSFPAVPALYIKRFQIIRNLVPQIVLNQVSPLRFLPASQLVQLNSRCQFQLASLRHNGFLK